MQNQNVDPDFWMYFDIKSLSFAKINTPEIFKPLHSEKLVQAKVVWHKYTNVVK